MPNDATECSQSATIYHHLREIERLHGERERLDRQIGDLGLKRREANRGYHHHVAAVEGFFEAVPGVVVELFGTAFYVDSQHGFQLARLRDWSALVPTAEPMSAQVKNDLHAIAEAARLPYVPESVAITPPMEERSAFEAALMTPYDDAEEAELAER